MLSKARKSAARPEEALERIAHAFMQLLMTTHAMFTRATKLHFAAADTPPQLKAAFAELRKALTAVARERDLDTLTEVLRAALHGLTVLSCGGRLRPEHDSVRLDLLAAQFTRFAVALASPGREVGAANGSLSALPTE